MKGEKDEILATISQSERTLAEWKSRVNKLEEDNAKLRRALEQSMTRHNRMSIDSDFLVDRLAGFNFELKFLLFNMGYFWVSHCSSCNQNTE